MKRIFFIVALLATLITKAQYPIITERAQLLGSPTTAIRAQGTLYVDSLLYLPLNLNVNLARLYRPGALFYQISDSSLYAWTGSQFWRIGGGGGTGDSVNVPTNLTVTRTATTLTINNSNGTAAIIPLADGVEAGVLGALDYQRFNNKLDNVNLGMTRSATGVTITNSAGNEAILPLGDASFAGLVPPAKYVEWNNKLSTISTRYSIANNGSSASPLQLVNDVSAPGANMVYGTSSTGAKGWKPDPGGAGGGSEVVQITYATFDASSGLATDKIYYITDAGREGSFKYVGTVANQTSDNGGTIIVNNGLQQFKRIYSDVIYANWFGLTGPHTSAPSSAVQTANVNAVRAALSVATNYEKVATYQQGFTNAAAAYWLNDSIVLKATFENHYYFIATGTWRFTHAGDGFIIDGGFGSRFEHKAGRIIGPGTGATDSAGFRAYTGTGVLLRNANQTNVEVWEVEGWHRGVAQTGEAFGGVGTSAFGAQFNVIRFNYIHHNYEQVRIATHGPAGTSGNWNNYTFWYGGRLGRGGVNDDSGGGGWFGLVIKPDLGSTSASYNISAHNLYDFGFENLRHGLVAENCESITFYGARFEAAGVKYHINLDPSTAKHVTFQNGAAMGEYFFVKDREGYGTRIRGRQVSGQVTTAGGGVSTTKLGDDASAVPTNPGMSGITYTAGTLLISSDYYPGFTAVNNLVAGYNKRWLYSKFAQYPTILNGFWKINGEERHGMYKPTYLAIGAVTGPNVTAPPNLGYIRFEGDEATIVTLNDGDDIQHSQYFETFKVEYNTSFPLTIQNAQGATIVPSSSFSSLGVYEITWRSGIWVVKSQSSGGASNIVPVAAGGAANANGFTYNTGNGNFQLTRASEVHPGVVIPGAQNLGGEKISEQFTAPVFSVADALNGWAAFNIRRRQNGISINGTSTPNPTSTGFSVAHFESESSGRNMVISLGQRATNSAGIGVNPTDLVMFTEKATGGFEWRASTGYSNFALSGGVLRGKVFANGNWLIQSGGTPTDAGYKFDVQGSARITGLLNLPDYANAEAMMMVVNPNGDVAVQTIPTGGTSGSSIFSAGLGTGSPQYRTAGPVNIGVNPSQSWAWSHYGASCNTCGPGSTARAIWEWVGTSQYVTSPRPNSWDYNGAVPRFTPNNGIPGRILTENNDVPISGNKSYEALDIHPQYIDRGSAPLGDNLISNGFDGSTFRAPNYEMLASLTSPLTISSTSSTSVLSVSNGMAETLPAGSRIKFEASGNISVGTADQPNFNLTFGGTTQLVQFTTFPVLSGSNRPFELEITITKQASGWIMSGHMVIDNGTLDINEIVNNDASTALPTSGNLAFSYDWDNGGNSITFQTTTIEIFRRQ